MTDIELLKLAAKAAGYELHIWGTEGAESVARMDTSPPTNWNPLADDGDALRLVAHLRLVVHVWDDGTTASSAKTLPNGDDPDEKSASWASADVGDDEEIFSATRRAIVRAAAAIGKSMK